MDQSIDRKDESEYTPEDWGAAIQGAAKAGDAFELARLLWRSGALAGIRGRVAARWDALAPHDIDDVISESVAVVYEHVRAGNTIRSVLGFVWRVALRVAYATWQERLPGLIPNELLAPLTAAERARRPDDDHDARMRAIAIAKSLVPRLGQERIQQVMNYWLDALADGRWDIEPAEVAEALGIPGGIVRTALSRGHLRLKRIASEAGLHATVDDLIAIADETIQADDDRYDEEEDNDEEVRDDDE